MTDLLNIFHEPGSLVRHISIPHLASKSLSLSTYLRAFPAIDGRKLCTVSREYSPSTTTHTHPPSVHSACLNHLSGRDANPIPFIA